MLRYWEKVFEDEGSEVDQLEEELERHSKSGRKKLDKDLERTLKRVLKKTDDPKKIAAAIESVVKKHYPKAYKLNKARLKKTLLKGTIAAFDPKTDTKKFNAAKARKFMA